MGRPRRRHSSQAQCTAASKLQDNPISNPASIASPAPVARYNRNLLSPDVASMQAVGGAASARTHQLCKLCRRWHINSLSTPGQCRRPDPCLFSLPGMIPELLGSDELLQLPSDFARCGKSAYYGVLAVIDCSFVAFPRLQEKRLSLPRLLVQGWLATDGRM